MNPIENLILGLQDLMSQVPALVQPLIVVLAAAIPFVEGEVASALGVWAGLNPVLAFAAAAIGNFLSVAVVVLFGAKARAGIVRRRARRQAATPTPVAVGAGGSGSDPVLTAERDADEDRGGAEGAKPESKARKRFSRFVVRFGVPGASILGPLALPTQFTSAILVASGVSRGWVLLWQAVAIVLWTALTTAIATGVLALVA